MIITVTWLLVSLVLCAVLGVFRPRTIALGPGRFSQLNLAHFGAAILLYLGLSVIAAQFIYARHPELMPQTSTPAAAASATTASSSAPATTASSSAPATATSASAPAAAASSAPATATSAAAPASSSIAAEIEEKLVECFPPLAISLAILLLAHYKVVGRLAGFGIAPAGLPRGILLGVLAAVLLAPWMQIVFFCTDQLMQLLRTEPAPIHPLLELTRSHPDHTLVAIILFSGIIVAPFSEEILFRGLLQTVLLKTFRMFMTDDAPAPATDAATKAAMQNEFDSDDHPIFYVAPRSPARSETMIRFASIFITAGLFALVHISVEGWEAMAPLFLLAVVLGYLYERTGSLWAPIALHACFNIVGFTLFMTQ